MGKHEAGFPRVARDFYPTPAWVIEALAEHVDLAGRRIWECACGNGQMAEALAAAGATVYASDIEHRGYCGQHATIDFTTALRPDSGRLDGLVTNPPFGNRGKLAETFITVGLHHIADIGFLALLLPVDFDSAKTRMHLFAGCPHYAGKIVLTKRVVWFANANKRRENPKENTAWFLWQRNAIKERPPCVLYAPRGRA